LRASDGCGKINLLFGRRRGMQSSKLLFYVALALSALVTVFLLSGAANFGFGPLIAAGPTAVLVVTVMLLNPVLFGLLGVVKRESCGR
jgi:uncharacterized membrane protein